MRPVFPSSDCCVKGHYQEENHGRCSRIMMALFVLLLSTVPLRAQSAVNVFPGLQEFISTAETPHSYDLGLPNLGFTATESILAARTNDLACTDRDDCTAWGDSNQPISAPEVEQEVQGTRTDTPEVGSKASSALIAQHQQRPDRNLDIYYRNRREFSLDVGWHPVNIPFIYDFAVGDGYNMTPLKYTLVPIIASLRWHVTNVGWRSIFRGNMDFTFSGSITAIPRGPETHYYSFDFGIRRNFVYRNWKVVPFFEQRGGAGIINAKEPLGVLWAQGQNLTFTYNMGAGARYNINSKYSFSAGMNYMHISNAYLSQPQFYNYGINVYGPMFGLDVRLGKPHHASQ